MGGVGTFAVTPGKSWTSEEHWKICCDIWIESREGLSAKFDVDVVCFLVMGCADVHHVEFICCKHWLEHNSSTH